MTGTLAADAALSWFARSTRPSTPACKASAVFGLPCKAYSCSSSRTLSKPLLSEDICLSPSKRWLMVCSDHTPMAATRAVSNSTSTNPTPSFFAIPRLAKRPCTADIIALSPPPLSVAADSQRVCSNTSLWRRNNGKKLRPRRFQNAGGRSAIKTPSPRHPRPVSAPW
ncbi:hypothetical protein D3C76_1088800 [compost metagenome]